MNLMIAEDQLELVEVVPGLVPLRKLNIHSERFDTKIQRIKNEDRWHTVIGFTHESVIRDFADCIFTNLTQRTFTPNYLRKHPCSDCGQPSTDRCHGIGEERQTLLKKAMMRVWPDASKPIALKEIVIAFLEEHKYTSFTLKCHSCHIAENKSSPTVICEECGDEYKQYKQGQHIKTQKHLKQAAKKETQPDS